MARAIQFIIFFTIFFGIYLGMHLYVFFRLFGMLGLMKGLSFILISLAFAISLPVASILERYFSNILTKILYTISATWFGVLFLLFTSLIVYEIVRLFISANPRTAAFVIHFIVGILTIYSIINSFFVVEKNIDVQLENLDKEYTIVQITDLHLGSIRDSGFLKKVVGKTNKIDPDLVLITGDITDGAASFTNKTIAPLKNIKAKTYFTTGNHERFSGVDKIEKMLKPLGVETLRNKAVDFHGLQIIGIDDHEEGFGSPNNIISRISINKSKPSILMYHPPSGIKEANAVGVNLQLSGHTHNGQVFPFNLITKLFYPYIKGLYNYNGTWIYVSPGTGTWGPPMRLGSRNEISVIHLKKT